MAVVPKDLVVDEGYAVCLQHWALSALEGVVYIMLVNLFKVLEQILLVLADFLQVTL